LPNIRHLRAHRTILWGCIFATKARIDDREKLVKQQYLPHMSHNMVNFGPLAAEIASLVWGTPANIQRVSRLGFVSAATSLNGSQPNFAHDVWPSPGLVHYIYILRALARLRNFPRCNIHFASKSSALLYWQRYCTALDKWASAKLCGVKQRAPPIFGRAAITLGIGPRSSFFFPRLFSAAADWMSTILPHMM